MSGASLHAASRSALRPTPSGSIPSTLTLLGQTFTLERVSPGHDELISSKADIPKAGTASLSRQRIFVADDMGADQERDTVLHEALHLLMRLVNLIPKDAEEERIVVALAPLLLDAMRRNPALVGYLMEP